MNNELDGLDTWDYFEDDSDEDYFNDEMDSFFYEDEIEDETEDEPLSMLVDIDEFNALKKCEAELMYLHLWGVKDWKYYSLAIADMHNNLNNE